MQFQLFLNSLSCPFVPHGTQHMLHVISTQCVAHDLHTIAPGRLECTYWRRFPAQWGDCQKSQTAPLNVIFFFFLLLLLSLLLSLSCSMNPQDCFNQEKFPRRKRELKPRSAALEADALTARPTRRSIPPGKTHAHTPSHLSSASLRSPLKQYHCWYT